MMHAVIGITKKAIFNVNMGKKKLNFVWIWLPYIHLNQCNPAFEHLMNNGSDNGPTAVNRVS